MAKKSLYVVCGLSIVTCILQITGALLPMHKLGLTLGGVKLYVMMNTHLTNVVIYGADAKHQAEALSQLQSKGEVANPSWWQVENIAGTHNLEDIRFHMCTPALRLTWLGLCEGFDAAYSTGIAVIVFLVTNLLCQGVGCYLLYDYSTRKQNPKYREISASMILGSGGIFLVVLVGYFFAALGKMNDMNGGAMSVVFQPSSASGATSGFIVLIMALIVQMLQGALLLTFTRDEFGEDGYFDDKEAREVGLELGRLGGSNPQQQVGGFGIQPGMQPNMMMPASGTTIMQPMGTPMMATGAAAW